MAELLVNTLKVDPKWSDQYNQTALFYAARNDRVELIEFFAKCKLDLDHKDSLLCETPIFYAAAYGSLNAIKMLHKLGASLNCINVKG